MQPMLKSMTRQVKYPDLQSFLTLITLRWSQVVGEDSHHGPAGSCGGTQIGKLHKVAIENEVNDINNVNVNVR